MEGITKKRKIGKKDEVMRSKDIEGSKIDKKRWRRDKMKNEEAKLIKKMSYKRMDREGVIKGQ